MSWGESMITIGNDRFTVEINELGAELSALLDGRTGIQYIWDAGPAWRRRAPVLFPNVGGYKENAYLFQGRRYEIVPHGLARDWLFTVAGRGADYVTMLLRWDEETLKMYPFKFEFYITHRLTGNTLSVEWTVRNLSDEEMFFAVGGHPGFKFIPGTYIGAYTMEFEKAIDIITGRINGRFFDPTPVILAENVKQIRLDPALFEKDVIVLENRVESVTLSDSKDYRLAVRFPGFPLVGLWTAPAALPNAEYLCIEPWFGIGDYIHEEIHDIRERPYIQSVAPGGEWNNAYYIDAGNV